MLCSRVVVIVLMVGSLGCEKKTSPSSQASDESAPPKIQIVLSEAEGAGLNLTATRAGASEKLRILAVENFQVKRALTTLVSNPTSGIFIKPEVNISELAFGFTSVRVEIPQPDDQSVLPFACLMGPEVLVTLDQPVTLPCNADSSWQAYQEGDKLPVELKVASPVSWKVFQRSKDGDGRIKVTLDHPGLPARYGRVRLLGPGQDSIWQTFVLGSDKTINFEAAAAQGGWMQVELLIYDDKQQLMGRELIERVGLGEVFLVGGGRNSSNCGAVPLSANDQVATTNGEDWQKGNDPQLGTQDQQLATCQGGSPWPAVGTTLSSPDKWGVPVAFASTSHQRTTIEHWLSGMGDKDLYGTLVERANQLSPQGFRAVIWHQGEEDTPAKTSTEQYAKKLRALIARFWKDVGWQVPWIVAQASWCLDNNHYGVKWGESVPVRTAQMQVWEDEMVFQGPDTDTLRGDHRATPEGNCSWSEKGATAAASLWVPRLEHLLNSLSTSTPSQN